MSKVSSGQAPSTLIPKYIGSDFDKVVTVADNIEDVKQIADAIDAGMLEYTDEIVIVADNIGAVVTVADDIASVVTVATNVADVVTVAQNITDVIAVGDNIADVVAVSGVNQQVSQIAPHIDEVVIVAEHIGEVDTVSDNIEYVIDVAEGLNGMPSTVFSGPNPPTVTPIPEGATWFCTENGKTYIYYVDVDSSQWVECMPQSGFPTEVSGISDTIRDGVVATAPTENAVFDALSGKANSVHTHTPAEAGAAPAVHGHAISDVSGLQGALDGKSPTGHTHTPAEAGAAPAVHGHAIADVAGLREELDGKAPKTHTHTPGEVGAAPAEHGHDMGDVEGLAEALNGKVSATDAKVINSLSVTNGSSVELKATPTDVQCNARAPDGTIAYKLVFYTPSEGHGDIALFHYDSNGVFLGEPYHYSSAVDEFAMRGPVSLTSQGTKPASLIRRDFLEAKTWTAAAGNADIVASNHGQVGTYKILRNETADHAYQGTLIFGSGLTPVSVAGDDAGVPGGIAGTWKCLGFAGSWEESSQNSSAIWIRVDDAILFKRPFTLLDARWDDAEHNSVTATVMFTDSGKTMPFTAARDDSEAHGRWLFALARDGQFGPVAEFVPPTPLEVAARDNPPARKKAMMQASAQAQHFDMMGEPELAAAWRANYRALHALEASPEWPLAPQWPVAPESAA